MYTYHSVEVRTGVWTAKPHEVHTHYTWRGMKCTAVSYYTSKASANRAARNKRKKLGLSA